MELTFAKRDYQYKSGDGHTHTYTQMEYVVDGVDLSIRLGIADLDVLAICTRLTPLELSYRARELRGLAKPGNQFGSGRLVLYGCHCGCDYCGVISCIAKRENGMVVWSDIRGEEFCKEITPVAKLAFSAEQVDSALESLIISSV